MNFFFLLLFEILEVCLFCVSCHHLSHPVISLFPVYLRTRCTSDSLTGKQAKRVQHTRLSTSTAFGTSPRHEGELCLEYATHGAGPTVYPAADPGDFFVRSFTALLLLLLYCYVARQQRCTSVWYFAGPGAFQALFLLPHVVSPSALRR